MLRMNSNLKNKIKFLIAGSGENKTNITKQVKSYSLQNNIIFNGELDEQLLKKWFNKIDLYLHPSFGEGMSTSILQAMSSSTPILASNVRGINNLIGKKKYLGMLFDNNIHDLKKKIIYFIKIKKNEYRKFQIIQRNYFLKNHNINSFRNKYRKVLNDIL